MWRAVIVKIRVRQDIRGKTGSHCRVPSARENQEPVKNLPTVHLQEAFEASQRGEVETIADRQGIES